MSWKTEVFVENEWVSNGLRFATKDEAERAGQELLSRWFLPTDSRATESEDPVNWEFPVEAPKPRPIEDGPERRLREKQD